MGVTLLVDMELSLLPPPPPPPKKKKRCSRKEQGNKIYFDAYKSNTYIKANIESTTSTNNRPQFRESHGITLYKIVFKAF
mmetsp:Transcript_17497/g.24597  ORF Transcript_17497/g.24597 Transcript_17497/m.24597 type:complete len:80 (-) Transcript_17497:176-415(-)